MKISLTALRKDSGMTQADLANALGVNYPTIVAWEKLSGEDVKKIAALFKIAPENIRIPK